MVEVARPDIGYNHPKFGGWVIATDREGNHLPSMIKADAMAWDDALTAAHPHNRYRIRKLDGPAYER